jgi:hypothetical protein
MQRSILIHESVGAMLLVRALAEGDSNRLKGDRY